jgi:Bacterial pre-peptidase C-terminal domain
LVVKDTTLPAIGDKKNVKAGAAIELKNAKGGAAFTGEIAQGDSLYQKKKIHKLFLFEMEAGKTYQIDQVSGALDSYLYLEDPNGNLLAKDDDGGGFPDARIIHKATKAGKYRIIATSLRGNQTGAFTLTIRETDGTPRKDEKGNLKDKREGLNQANPPLEQRPAVIRVQGDIRIAPVRPRD